MRWGGIIGAALGLAAGFATGGLAFIPMAVGAASGMALGSKGDAMKEGSKAAKQAGATAREERARQSSVQAGLASERARADISLGRERRRVEAGMARSMRRRFSSGLSNTTPMQDANPNLG